jgi:hypothetical protein
MVKNILQPLFKPMQKHHTLSAVVHLFCSDKYWEVKEVECTLDVAMLRLIHTLCHAHAIPLPFSDCAISFMKFHMIAGSIWTASPTVKRIGMRLITTFTELCLVARRSSWAGYPHAVSGWPMLIHTCHAMPTLRCRGLEKSLSELHGLGMARALQGMCESNKAALRKSNGRHNLNP